MRVYARDNQDHGDVPDSYIDVTIDITDINDNTPEFSNLPDSVTFSEVIYYLLSVLNNIVHISYLEYQH